MFDEQARKLDGAVQNLTWSRRDFCKQAAMVSLAGSLVRQVVPLSLSAAATCETPSPGRLLFTSRGRTCVVNADGSQLRYLEFDVPNQATWQPSALFPDGRRIVMLSMEPRRDGPGKPFDQYYTQTPTHIWIYDLDADRLDEICTRDRPAPFMTPALLLDNDRLLVQVVKNGVGQILSMRTDGSDQREFTCPGEGLPYGLSLSPDGQRVAFHLASPQGYQVWTSDLVGQNRKQLAAHPDHLYFGTNWSPDGEWVVYVDCHFQTDPGHDWCDVCIGRADGGQHRVLTSGQSMWFAATYGDPSTRGGGSNVPSWTRDGRILFPRRTPGAKVAWVYQAGRADLDHFNREFKPREARGGTEICQLDPATGAIDVLTRGEPLAWDFRGSQSPDGQWLAFCRAASGHPPAIWVANADGTNPQQIAQGHNHQGADHPRWLPTRPSS